MCLNRLPFCKPIPWEREKTKQTNPERKNVNQSSHRSFDHTLVWASMGRASNICSHSPYYWYGINIIIIFFYICNFKMFVGISFFFFFTLNRFRNILWYIKLTMLGKEKNNQFYETIRNFKLVCNQSLIVETWNQLDTEPCFVAQVELRESVE